MHNTLPALTPVVLSLAATAADVPDMERALRAVLALHSRTGWGMESLCDHCFNGIEERVDWPCPTVRVIEEALHA